MLLASSLLLLTYLVAAVNGASPCQAKDYSEFENRIVCVCNATYCDEFPPIGDLQKGQIAVYTSSASGQRFERSDASFKVSSGTFRQVVTINPKKTYQRIIGFGGAFTDSTGINLRRLSANTQNRLMEAYYGPNGIGFTTGRVPIASCDMGESAYSYCDTDGDLQLKTFNLTREDFELKIPFLKIAQKLTNDNVKFFASPWSAPGWMKQTGKMVGGGPLKGDVDGEYYQTWARYFMRFFEEYHKQGISYWGVTMQNEPSSGASLDYGWQTMYFTPAMQRDFIKNLLGPALRGSPLTRNIKLMINDDQRYMLPDTADEILADEVASSFVDGITVHWYEDFLFSADILSTTHERHPSKFILPSEASNGWLLVHGPSMGDWSRAEDYAKDIMDDLQNWAAGWTDWNLCLNEQGGPTFVGNYLDASIIVNNTVDEFYKQPQFYALGHFSKLITPGSQRIDLQIAGYSKDLLLEGVAFRTAYGQYVVVFVNRNEQSDYKLLLRDPSNSRQSAEIDVNRNSIVSAVWNTY